MPPQKMQSIGFEDGMKIAEEKIGYSIKFRKTPTVSVENILFKQNEKYVLFLYIYIDVLIEKNFTLFFSWFDLSLLVLKDTERQITVQTLSQATPVPVDEFLEKIQKERSDLSSLNPGEQLATYVIVSRIIPWIIRYILNYEN